MNKNKKTKSSGDTSNNEVELYLSGQQDDEPILRLVDDASNDVVGNASNKEHENMCVEVQIEDTNNNKPDSTATILTGNEVFADRVELGHNQSPGKSFRFKDLSEVNVSERDIMPTLEEQRIQKKPMSMNGNWLNRLIILVILVAAAVGIWAFTYLNNYKVGKESREREIQKLKLINEKNDAEYNKKRNSIIETIKGYIEATTIEERAKWCRNSESTLRKMTQHYTSELTFDTYHFDSINNISQIYRAGKEVILTSSKVSSLSGGEMSKDKRLALMLEKQADGGYLVDWETAVIFQPDDWGQFVDSRSPKEHTFRVDLRDRSDYGPYLYEFSDDRKYQAYRVNIRNDNVRFLIAYAKRDSEIDQRLKEMLNSGSETRSKSRLKTDIEITRSGRSNKVIPLTLTLVFPENAQSSQCVEIIDIVSESWYVP